MNEPMKDEPTNEHTYLEELSRLYLENEAEAMRVRIIELEDKVHLLEWQLEEALLGEDF